MSSLIIMRALPTTGFGIVRTAGGGALGDVNIANLATPDPKEAAQLPANDSGAEYQITLDLGAAVSFDTAFLGFLSAGLADSITIYSGLANSIDQGPWTGPQAFLAPSDQPAPRRRHGLVRAAARTSRYLNIRLTPSSAARATIGIIGIGQSIQPAFGREWGSGRQPIDMSSVNELQGGGFGIERGARKAAFQFTCSELSDAEVAALWAVAEEVGSSAPVLVCEDPDATSGLNERLHWGLFERPEAYTRESPNQNRWSFRVRQWA